MDIVIPLNSASHHNNIELRFALRSFELYLPHDRVIIVGERPKWLQNIIHIPFKDTVGCHLRASNIYRKILAAFEISSEQVIFANDDHFMLQYTSEMPYHHKGLMKVQSDDSYGRLQQNTLSLYPGCYDFDTHCPIVYDKALFPVLNMPNHGYGIKSAYCAHNRITGSYYPDCKINKPCDIRQVIAGRPYFSIGDGAFETGIEEVLRELYPNPSKYETPKLFINIF